MNYNELYPIIMEAIANPCTILVQNRTEGLFF